MVSSSIIPTHCMPYRMVNGNNVFDQFSANLSEVQSLIDRGVPLNATIKVINGRPISTALHLALKNQHIADGMLKHFDDF